MVATQDNHSQWWSICSRFSRIVFPLLVIVWAGMKNIISADCKGNNNLQWYWWYHPEARVETNMLRVRVVKHVISQDCFNTTTFTLHSDLRLLEKIANLGAKLIRVNQNVFILNFPSPYMRWCSVMAVTRYRSVVKYLYYSHMIFDTWEHEYTEIFCLCWYEIFPGR